jgi:photosystem II stability/assembly factor-like uncharacterized protein
VGRRSGCVDGRAFGRRALAAACTLVVALGLGLAPSARAGIWTPLPTGTTEAITAIEYQESGRFWFATGSGSIFTRDPATGAFAPTLTGTGTPFTDIRFQDAPGGVGLAVGEAGAIYRSPDGGATWALVAVGAQRPNGCDGTYLPLGRLTSIAFASPTIVYVLGEGRTILRSTDAGMSFTDANTRPGPGFGCRVDEDVTDGAFLPTNPLIGFLVTGAFGSIYGTVDGLASPATRRCSCGPNGIGTIDRLALDGANPNRQWAVNRIGGGGYRRTDDAWSTSVDPTFANLAGTAPAPPVDVAFAGGTVLIAGEAGEILTSRNGSTFYRQRADGPLAAVPWGAVDMATASQGAVGGAGGALVVTDRATSIPDLIAPGGTIAGPANGVAGQPLTFTALVADDPAGSGIDPSSLQWTAPAQPGVGGASATFTFAAAGTYTVRLAFRDRDGNAGAATLDVAVSPAPLPMHVPFPLPTPVRPTTLTLAATPARARTAPFRITVAGRLVLPPTVARAACAGRVVVAFRLGSRALTARPAALALRQGACRYRVAVTLRPGPLGRRPRTVAVSARFAGNGLLLGRRSRILPVRLG